ncbi:MAG: tRNA(Met) cytidine acetyltransferase [Gammaproteobacteria bacterium]|nr:tRNA(Met) cytidine acetyltransferase [Gammaproteobacteria bacterium]
MPTAKTLAALSRWNTALVETPNAHRQLLVVSGSAHYCKDVIDHIKQQYSDHETLLLGTSLYPETNSAGIAAYRQILGAEYSLAIVDTFETFRPNAILAVAGTVTQGGMMVVCCPDFNEWPVYHETSTGHYLSYGEQLQYSHLRAAILRQFGKTSTVAILRENYAVELPEVISAQPPVAPPSPFISAEQQRLYNLITAGRPIESALLTADRGRGKSTLLGMIAGHYMATQEQSVIITSRYAVSVNQVFAGVLLTCPQATQIDRHRVSFNELTCQWLPLDHPSLSTLTDSALLLIDEAASIPVAQLTALCQQAKHLLLSTTVRGYEGSGRGFITRFIPWLKQHRPDIRHYKLQKPIRWFDGDPLEQFWYRALCMDTTAVDTDKVGSVTHCSNTFNYKALDKQQFDSPANRQLLPLLMQAHYQTTGDELVRLYDSPANNTLLAIRDNEVIGVLNYQQEGGALLSDVASQIASGARRVNGHLSAQGLSVLLASDVMATATYWRINRIAVLSRYRREGIASTLINRLQQQAKVSGVDALTTSYGATPALTAFWNTNDFVPAKPGLKRDASSGEYSLLMFLPLSQTMLDVQALIAQRFSQELLLHPSPKTFGFPPSQSPFAVNESIQACSFAILEQVVSGSRSLQHARGSVAWLLETQAEVIAETESKVVLQNFLANSNTLNNLTKRYRLSGKRETERFITSHLGRVISRLER